MYLLQSKVVENTTTVILNYGAVGAMLLMCIIALIYMSKFFIKQAKEQSVASITQIKLLQDQLGRYIEEDRKLMMDVVGKNTYAFQVATEIIEEAIKVIHELRKTK